MAGPGSLVAALLAGACAWTLAEYFLHRVVFHALPHAALGAKEHRRHHAQPDWFAPAWQKALAALVVTGAMLPGLALVAGPRLAAAFTTTSHMYMPSSAHDVGWAKPLLARCERLALAGEKQRGDGDASQRGTRAAQNGL